MNLFLRRHLSEHVHAVCPRIIEDLVSRLQAVVTTADASMLRRVGESVLLRTALCLKIDGGRLNEYCIGFMI
jgi:hypothetical protein